MSIEDYFPNLQPTGYRTTSPPSAQYNCIAWAAGQDDAWWEPDPMHLYYWPPEAPREYSVSAYVRAFETLGFTPCADSGLESGFEKVALYALGEDPTRAARQLHNGQWTSKLGQLDDIEHTLDGLVGAHYGTAVQFLKRPSTSLTGSDERTRPHAETTSTTTAPDQSPDGGELPPPDR